MDHAGFTLAELIDDPLTGLVMKSDGVDRRELELLLEQVARKRLLAPPRKPLSASALDRDGAMLTPPTSQHGSKVPEPPPMAELACTMYPRTCLGSKTGRPTHLGPQPVRGVGQV